MNRRTRRNAAMLHPIVAQVLIYRGSGPSLTMRQYPSVGNRISLENPAPNPVTAVQWIPDFPSRAYFI